MRPADRELAKLVVALVEVRSEVPADEIVAPERGRQDASIARALVSALLREGAGWPMTAIGEFLGRDHSSVTYQVERWRRLVQNDAEYAEWDRDLRPLAEDLFTSFREGRLEKIRTALEAAPEPKRPHWSVPVPRGIA